MCLYPRLTKNRKYIKNKKNGGNIPPLPLIQISNGKWIEDVRVLEVAIGCGKCMECMKKKSREWQVRLLEDIRHNKNAHFVTLTFSNESIKELGKEINYKIDGYDRDNDIAKLGVRRFLERWRKKHKKSIRHWLVTELGHNGTENIHFHGLVWTNETGEEIRKHWKYGYIWDNTEHKGWVNEQTVNYITKYLNKTDLKHKEYIPIMLTSSGIGRGYIERADSINNKYKEEETSETYKNRQGYKMALPIYYRNHLYTDQEKEKLWLEKLNKNVRYVNGKEIDISKGEEPYYKALKEARKLNKELKYGDDEINWERKKYEIEKRNINYIKRITSDDKKEIGSNENIEKLNEIIRKYE